MYFVCFQLSVYFSVIWIAREAERIPQLGNDKVSEVLKHTEIHIISGRLTNSLSLQSHSHTDSYET